MQAKKVVVVGAGISGLQVARALLKRSQHPLVIEQGEAVGGIWNNRAYQGLGVQAPHAFHEFPEFPWPAGLVQDEAIGGRLSSQAVQAYVQAYAEHFGLLQHIRFRCQLLRLQPAPQGGWAIIYLDRATGLYQVVAADFVVMATGMHAVPNVPVYKGMQHFRGLQLHSNDLTDPSVLAGKKVVVVGGGRSALDYAAMVAATRQAAHVTSLHRRAHWPVPQQVAPGLPLQRFLFSQLPSLLLPPYYTASASHQGLAKLSAPLRLVLWRYLQRCIKQQCGLREGLLPSMSLQQDLLYHGQLAGAEWIGILQQQQGDSGVMAAARSSAQGVVGASGSVAALSSLQPLSPCHERGNTAAGDSKSDGFEESSVQQAQDAGSSGRKAGKGLLRGFLCSTSSTVRSRLAARDSLPLSCPQQDGTGSSSGDGARRRSLENSSSCNSSSGHGCTVVSVLGEVEELGRDWLLLRSGGTVGADVVLYCTGFNRSYEFLDEVVRARLGIQKDGLPLFRHMLPPQVPALAFVGCEASSYNAPLTAGLQAEWLAAVVAGHVPLPMQQAMQEDVRKMTAWSRRVFPPHPHRASAVQLFMLHYHEQLLQDMQLAPPRHGWQLQPLTAKDYRFVFTSPLHGRLGRMPSFGHRGCCVGSRRRMPAAATAGVNAPAATAAAAATTAERSSGCLSGAEGSDGQLHGAAVSVAAAAAQAQQAQVIFTAVQVASAAAAFDAVSSDSLMSPHLQQQQQQQWVSSSCASMSEQGTAAHGVQQALALACLGTTGRPSPVVLSAEHSSVCEPELQCSTYGSPAVLPSFVQQQRSWMLAQPELGLARCSGGSADVAAASPAQPELLDRSDSLGMSVCAQTSGAIWHSKSLNALSELPTATPPAAAAAAAAGLGKPALTAVAAAAADEYEAPARVSSTMAGSSSHTAHRSSGSCGTSAAGDGSAARLLQPMLPQQLTSLRRTASTSCSEGDTASVPGSALRALLSTKCNAAGPPTPTALASCTGMQLGAGSDVTVLAALDAGSVMAAASAACVSSLAVSATTTGTSKCCMRGMRSRTSQLRRCRSCSCSVLAPAVPSAAASLLRRPHCSLQEAAAGSLLQSSDSSTGMAGGSVPAAAAPAADDDAPVRGVTPARAHAVQQQQQQQQVVDSSSSESGAPVDDGDELMTRLPTEQQQKLLEQCGQSKQRQAVLRWLESLAACDEDADTVDNSDHVELQQMQQRGREQHISSDGSNGRSCTSWRREQKHSAARPAVHVSCFAAAAGAAAYGRPSGSSSRAVSDSSTPTQLPLFVSGGAPGLRHRLSSGSRSSAAAQQQQQQQKCYSCTPGQLEAALTELQRQQQQQHQQQHRRKKWASHTAVAVAAVICPGVPPLCAAAVAGSLSHISSPAATTAGTASVGGSPGRDVLASSPAAAVAAAVDGAGRTSSKLQKCSTASPSVVAMCLDRLQHQQQQLFGCQDAVITAATPPGAVVPAVEMCMLPPESSASAVPCMTATPDAAAAAAAVSVKQGLRSLARHLSLPVVSKLRPAACSAAGAVSANGSVCSRARSAQLRFSQGGSAAATSASGSANGSDGKWMQPQLHNSGDAECQLGTPTGHYEYYSQHQHLHAHTRRLMHTQPHEQHPLASLKHMLQQMRHDEEAYGQQQQHAALLAGLQERQVASAGRGTAATPGRVASEAAAQTAGANQRASLLRWASHNSSGSATFAGSSSSEQRLQQAGAQTPTGQRQSVRGINAATARQAAVSSHSHSNLCQQSRDGARVLASPAAGRRLSQRLTAAWLADSSVSAQQQRPRSTRSGQRRPSSSRSARAAAAASTTTAASAAAAAAAAPSVAGGPKGGLQDAYLGYDSRSSQPLRSTSGPGLTSGSVSPAGRGLYYLKQADHHGVVTGASSLAVPVPPGLQAAGDVAGAAVGWADARTHDWLQQQLLFGQMLAEAPLKLPAAAATPRGVATAAAGCRRRAHISSSGLVLERLGSKEAAVRQLQLLQRDPASAKQLVQSLKAWQASPEAAAAAKLAARCSDSCK